VHLPCRVPRPLDPNSDLDGETAPSTLYFHSVQNGDFLFLIVEGDNTYAHSGPPLRWCTACACDSVGVGVANFAMDLKKLVLGRAVVDSEESPLLGTMKECLAMVQEVMRMTYKDGDVDDDDKGEQEGEGSCRPRWRMW